MGSCAGSDPAGDTLGSFLGYRIRRAWGAVRSDLARTLQPFDLRMTTYSSLVLVRENPGLSQARLAHLLQMERPNLVAIINELEQRGLVNRNPAPQDRRAYALHLTEAGQELCTQATLAVQAHENRLFDGLSDTDRAAMAAVLTRIRQNAERV